VTEEATGRPVEPDDPWVAAKKEMYPAPSLTRIAANARFTVATVSLVAAGLTAFGLASAASVRVDALARAIWLAAVGTAVAAVLLALSYLGLRLEQRNYENYVEVKRWYGRQFQRAWLVVLASRLLIVAVLLAGVAGIVAVSSGGGTDPPVFNVTVTVAPDGRTMVAAATATGLRPGDPATIQVTDEHHRLLVSRTTSADATGTAKVEAEFDAHTAPRHLVTLRLAGRDCFTLQMP
jgi:hypothetical protein